MRSLEDAGIDDIAVVGPNTGIDGSAAALVARAGCVWHPALVRRLVQTSIAPDDMVAFGTADAAVFLCGANRVAAAVSSLAARRPPHADRRHAIEPPEFITEPRTA